MKAEWNEPELSIKPDVVGIWHEVVEVEEPKH